MDHPALGVIIPGLVEAACQSVMEASHGLKGGEDESWARLWKMDQKTTNNYNIYNYN